MKPTCPKCGFSSGVVSIEELIGLYGVVDITDGKLDCGGYTEMLYDSSVTIGLHCQECNHELMFKDKSSEDKKEAINEWVSA